MSQPKESSVKQFICFCLKKHLSKDQIIDHLRLKGHLKLEDHHNITKIAPPQSSIDFQNSILNKIAKIAKTQIQIQASSNQLIQFITKNTSAIIQNLSNIVNLYKNLILKPQNINQIKDFEVINTFKLNSNLCTALTHHFQQQPAAEIYTVSIKTRNLKTQVCDIISNYVVSMQCMVVFSDENRVVTGGYDGAVRIWDLQTKSQTRFSLKHKDVVSSLALGNAEDLVLTGSFDASVRLWNVKEELHIHKFVGHTSQVTSVLFSQDQSTGFSGSFDKTIRILNLKSLTPERFINFQHPIWGICLISEENIIVSCGSNGSVSFLNLKDNKHSNAISHQKSHLTSICFAPNEEQFITGSIDGTVQVWATNGIKSHFCQKKHSGTIKTIKISNCSKFFATGSTDRTVIVWDFNKLLTIKLIQNLSRISSLYFVENSSSLLICGEYGINWCSISSFVTKKK